MPSDPRRALIQRNPQNDIVGVIQVIQVILVILSPSCILIAPLVRENPLISFLTQNDIVSKSRSVAQFKTLIFEIERNALLDGEIPITLIPFKIECYTLLVSSLAPHS